MSVEERLYELGIELPEPPPPAGNYIGAVSSAATLRSSRGRRKPVR